MGVADELVVELSEGEVVGASVVSAVATTAAARKKKKK